MSAQLAILFSSDLKEKQKINDCLQGLKDAKDVPISSGGVTFWLSKKEKKLYEKVKKRLEENSNYIKLLLNDAIVVKKIDGVVPSKEKNRLYLLLRKLEKKKSLLGQLMMLKVYLELGLNGKVESLINGILQYEFIHDFFYSETLYYENSKITDKVMAILEQLREKFDDSKLLSVLVAYLSYGVGPQMRNQIIREFDIPNKLSYVQSRIGSVNYGVRYPMVWAPWVEKYSSSIELESYLEKTSLYESLKEGKVEHIGALRSSFPKDEELRMLILKCYKLLKQSSDPYLRDLEFRLYQNENFVKYLIKNKIPMKPLFVEMRKFYRKSLEEKMGLGYSLYQLFKIGDIRKEYFPLALAIKNNGL